MSCLSLCALLLLACYAWGHQQQAPNPHPHTLPVLSMLQQLHPACAHTICLLTPCAVLCLCCACNVCQQDKALLYGVDVSSSKMFQSQRVRAAAAFAAAAHAGQVRPSVWVIACLHASMKVGSLCTTCSWDVPHRGVPHSAIHHCSCRGVLQQAV